MTASRTRVLVICGGIALAAIVGLGVHTVLGRGAGSAPPPASAALLDDELPHVEGPAIAFSTGFARRIGLRYAPVQRSSLTPVIEVPGTVTFDVEHVSAAGTRIRGFVRKVFKIEGDTVKKGEALAEIESAELGHAQADVAVAAAKRRAAERNAERERGLLSQSLTTARAEEVARTELEEQRAILTAASQRVAALAGSSAGSLGTYLVHSPVQGTIVKRSIAAGQSVEPHLIAFRVADLDHLWIVLHVFEREIGAISKSDSVEIAAAGDGDAKKIEGRVSYVGDVIDLESRSAEVRIKFDNSERLLRSGQSVVARIRAAALERVAVSVPIAAVTFVDGRPTVFVADKAGDPSTITRVVVAEVKLGKSDGQRQEVLEGIEEGQLVVTDGVFALKSELFR